MNVLIISRRTKNARVESCRIVDQFAERTGDAAWQTVITLEGVNTLRKLLRKTARRNTAVACHWLKRTDKQNYYGLSVIFAGLMRRGVYPLTAQRQMWSKAGLNMAGTAQKALRYWPPLLDFFMILARQGAVFSRP